jgi:hypothetical protein
MALGHNMKIRAADQRLVGNHRVRRPCGDQIEARVRLDKGSVTGLCVEIWIDRECACVIRPHERDADSVAIQMGAGESPPLKVSVPQRMMHSHFGDRLTALWCRDMSRYSSESSIEAHDGLTASAAITPDAAQPESLMLRLGLPYGHNLVLKPSTWARTVAVCPIGSGLHGGIEILVPPAVLSAR